MIVEIPESAFARDPPAQRIVLETPFKFTAVQVLAVPVWVTITENEMLWLSKVLSVGISVTLRVISADGLVQMATLPPPVVNAIPTVFPLMSVVFSATDLVLNCVEIETVEVTIPTLISGVPVSPWDTVEIPAVEA